MPSTGWISIGVEGPLPDGAGLIARYQKLTGVAAVATPHAERVSYEMTIYLSEAPPRKEFTELTTGGPNRFRISRTSDSGTQAWIRDGAAGWTHDANGWKATDGNRDVRHLGRGFIIQLVDPERCLWTKDGQDGHRARPSSCSRGSE